MQLYEKVQVGKATRYIEHVPAPINMPAIEQAQMITLLSTLTISMLISVSGQLPPHARFCREVKAVEAAVVRLAKLNAEPLDPVLVDIGVMAWNSAIHAMQNGLSGGAA
jgi:hypothetical protein